MASRKASRTDTSHPDPVGDYARAVLGGEIVAGPHVRNACQRHLADLEFGHERGLFFDYEAAQRVVDYFKDVLVLAKGKFEGVPFELQPSQKFIVGSIYGWKVRSTGFRRFRRVYVEQGKGNGKTPMAAGIGMYGLTADKEPGAEIYAAASMKSQAALIFQAAVAMWRQSPPLKEHLTPSGVNPVWQLSHLPSQSFFKYISSDEGLSSGPIPHCALCDELHEHPDGDMIEMLERGFKSRRQPILLMITNSGSDRGSVCWQEHVHAVRVAAGSRTAEKDPTFIGEIVDDQTFSYVCALDRDDDPLEDPSCWIKANPLLGITMPVKELERAVKQAKDIPGKLNNILRLHFCVWTDSDKSWIARPTLEAVLHDFDPAEHYGKKLFLSLDLSAKNDLTSLGAAVLTGTKEVEVEDENTGEVRIVRKPTVDAWTESWTPKATLRERSIRDQAPYDQWVAEGFLNAPPGRIVDLSYVAHRVKELSVVYEVAVLAYDRYGFKALFEPLLTEEGLTVVSSKDEAKSGLWVVEHPQGGKKKGAESGLWMPGSKDALESVIMEKRLRLRRDPVTISACMSAAVEQDAFENSWFSKRKATNRIDPLVALAMAVGTALLLPAAPEKKFQMVFLS